MLPIFDQHLPGPLVRTGIKTLQINVGKRCNQACLHCHVEAGPKRTEEMSREVAQALIELLAGAPGIETLDITGGAPELNANFRYLVRSARALDREVIDRCNLSILLEPGMDDLAEFLADNSVHIVASLPCYSSENVDAQRGKGVFARSIAALRRLNALGYGKPESGLALDLVYNPGGAFLPPSQEELELEYRERLRREHEVEFNRLLTLANLPAGRFADSLRRSGKLEAYLDLLVENFNGATVGSLMCRSQLNISWEGDIFDCDFNQMLGLPARGGARDRAANVLSLDSLEGFAGAGIATGSHCFGCTAGAGSSCGGALS